MKVKASAIIGICILRGLFLLSIVYASDTYDPAIPDLTPTRDQEVLAAILAERSEIVTASLKVPPLEAESRVEKRSTPFAAPRETLCALKGVRSSLKTLTRMLKIVVSQRIF